MLFQLSEFAGFDILQSSKEFRTSSCSVQLAEFILLRCSWMTMEIMYTMLLIIKSEQAIGCGLLSNSFNYYFVLLLVPTKMIMVPLGMKMG